MARKIGLNAKLYRGAAGAPAANEMKNVRDLSTPDNRTKVDISCRGSEWKLTETGMREHTLDWEMFWDETDVDFTAIKDAYNNRTAIALMCLSSSDGQGPDADYKIVKFEKKEPLDGPITVEVSAAPTYLTRYPAWHAA